MRTFAAIEVGIVSESSMEGLKSEASVAEIADTGCGYVPGSDCSREMKSAEEESLANKSIGISAAFGDVEWLEPNAFSLSLAKSCIINSLFLADEAIPLACVSVMDTNRKVNPRIAFGYHRRQIMRVSAT
jgi:hypothetical protein